jgi:hypothetical protein
MWTEWNQAILGHCRATRNPCPAKTKECLQEFLTTKDTKYPAWPSAGTKIDSHKGTKTRRRKIATEMPPKLCGFVAPCENQVFVFQGLASPSIRNLRKKTRFQQVVVRRETGGNESCATAKYANYAKRTRTSSADHVLASKTRGNPQISPIRGAQIGENRRTMSLRAERGNLRLLILEPHRADRRRPTANRLLTTDYRFFPCVPATRLP